MSIWKENKGNVMVYHHKQGVFVLFLSAYYSKKKSINSIYTTLSSIDALHSFTGTSSPTVH